MDLQQATAIAVTPAWTPWLDELPFGRVVYDCIDECSVHAPRNRQVARFRRWEDQLIERADGAIATAEVLRDSIVARRPGLPVGLVRNGVNDEFFRWEAPETEPSAASDEEARPVVGFVGALYEWVDVTLIDEVSRALPEVDFAFIGPHDGRSDLTELSRRPNVRFHGACRHRDVPARLATFDICWVPFRTDQVGCAANPIKIYEYLALGKPVVTTAVADLHSFGDLVRCGRSATEIAALLREELADPAVGTEERQAFAARNSWKVRAREILDFCDGLSGRRDQATIDLLADGMAQQGR